MNKIFVCKIRDEKGAQKREFTYNKENNLVNLGIGDYAFLKLKGKNISEFCKIVDKIENDSKVQVKFNFVYEIDLKPYEFLALKLFNINEKFLNFFYSLNEIILELDLIKDSFNIISNKKLMKNYIADSKNYRNILNFMNKKYINIQSEDIQIYKENGVYHLFDSDFLSQGIKEKFNGENYSNGKKDLKHTKGVLYKNLSQGNSVISLKKDVSIIGFYDLFLSTNNKNYFWIYNVNSDSTSNCKIDIDNSYFKNEIITWQIKNNYDLVRSNDILYITFANKNNKRKIMAKCEILDKQKYIDKKYIRFKVKEYYCQNEILFDYIDNESLKIRLEQLKRYINLSKLDIELSDELDSQIEKVLADNMYEEDIFEIEEDNFSNQNTEQMYKFKKGVNVIYYGIPGCGKSYRVDNIDFVDYKKDVSIPQIERYQTERVVFYNDYTYADFIGQVMPINKNNKLVYEFVPGPFVKILERALIFDLTSQDKPTRNFALIIEEINRGNAASIFGDIFQLLDRDKMGKSKYEITNDLILNYLKKKSNLFRNFDKIYIPKNLSIVATMNTTDQNLYVLDSAFLRRWQLEYVPNDIDNCIFKDKYIPYFIQQNDIKKSITWGNFVLKVNGIIRKQNNLENQDKQIGGYFVTDDYLVENFNLDFSSENKKFANKVLKFLWNDVFKYGNRYVIFDSEIEDFETLLLNFNKNKNVFSDAILKEFKYIGKTNDR